MLWATSVRGFQTCGSSRESASCVSSIGCASLPRRCDWRRAVLRAEAQSVRSRSRAIAIAASTWTQTTTRQCGEWYAAKDGNMHMCMWQGDQRCLAWSQQRRGRNAHRCFRCWFWGWLCVASLAPALQRFVTVDVASICQVKLPDACGAGWSPEALLGVVWAACEEAA